MTLLKRIIAHNIASTTPARPRRRHWLDIAEHVLTATTLGLVFIVFVLWWTS